MESSSIADQEELIKESLFSLVKTHIPSAQLSDIDEIVLSYVVGILEDIALDPDGQDVFDVDGFSEMLSAYLPEFVHIKPGLICEWIFKLSTILSRGKAKAAEEELEKESVALSRLNLSGSLSSSGRSWQSSSECSNSDCTSDSTKKRTHLLSETSDVSSDSSGEFSNHEDSFISCDLQMLQEMFPHSSIMEVRHCLTAAEGDVERAAQIILHRQDAGQSISNNINALQGSQRQRPAVNDEELKSRIIARYSYVDKDDDVREHRPVAPKVEPKKLVRYRDNKIVSLKGERYTEVRRDDCEDPAKVLKPSKTKAH